MTADAGLPTSNPKFAGGALAGLRVLDLTDASGRLAGKLLAEAGADVLRLRRGAPGAAMRDPALAARGGLLDWWHDGGTRRLPLDLERPADREAFRQLAARADLLVETEPPGRLAALGLDYVDLTALNPRLVHVSLTPFGRGGPHAGWQSSDLVMAVLGGALSVSGEPERPLNSWGRQTYATGSLFAAICGLAGVLAARRDGRGQHIDLSLQHCVVSCTEQVLMAYFFRQRWPERVFGRQRSLHWSGAYEVMACASGNVMVTPAINYAGLYRWMEADGFGDRVPSALPPEPLALAGFIPTLMEELRAWAATKESHEFFLEGQRRHLPFGEVQTVSEVVQNPQHAARGFLRSVAWDGPPLQMPGPLARLTGTSAPPPQPPPAGDISIEDALAAWSERPPSSSPGTESAALPLAGVRVLDFTQVLAGPYATRILADLGADVIKVQTAGRSAGANGNESPYFIMWNRSKRSVTLNMKHPDAIATVRRLIEQSDLVVENFSAGVLERWGIGYAAARDWNPRIIYLQMAGCGQDGPWRDFVSYAPTIHALSGLTYLTNHPGERDCGIGFSYTDHASGLAGAVAALQALYAREQTGEGQLIDLSQFEVGSYMVGPALLDMLANGREAHPQGNRDAFEDFVPNEVYRCADGWLAVTARDDGDWSRLTAVLGDPALSDATLATVDGRREQRALINERFATWAATRVGTAAMEELQAAGVPAGVVQTNVDLVERDPQLAHRDWVSELQHPTLGPYGFERFPATFSASPRLEYTACPTFGEHTFEVYSAVAGMTDDEIAAALAGGLFE